MTEKNKLESVSKEMMDELNKAHSLDEILESWYEGEKYYSSLLSYFKENRFSDEAYLKIIKHINGEPQFEAEKSKKYVVRSKKVDDEGMVTAERAREITDEYESALISALFDEVMHIILGAASSNKSSVIISDSSDSVDFSYYPGHALFTNLKNDGGAEKLEALGYEVSLVSEGSFGDKKHTEQSEYFKISW